MIAAPNCMYTCLLNIMMQMSKDLDVTLDSDSTSGELRITGNSSDSVKSAYYSILEFQDTAHMTISVPLSQQYLIPKQTQDADSATAEVTASANGKQPANNRYSNSVFGFTGAAAAAASTNKADSQKKAQPDKQVISNSKAAKPRNGNNKNNSDKSNSHNNSRINGNTAVKNGDVVLPRDALSAQLREVAVCYRSFVMIELRETEITIKGPLCYATLAEHDVTGIVKGVMTTRISLTQSQAEQLGDVNCRRVANAVSSKHGKVLVAIQQQQHPMGVSASASVSVGVRNSSFVQPAAGAALVITGGYAAVTQAKVR